MSLIILRAKITTKRMHEMSLGGNVVQETPSDTRHLVVMSHFSVHLGILGGERASHFSRVEYKHRQTKQPEKRITF